MQDDVVEVHCGRVWAALKVAHNLFKHIVNPLFNLHLFSSALGCIMYVANVLRKPKIYMDLIHILILYGNVPDSVLEQYIVARTRNDLDIRST